MLEYFSSFPSPSFSRFQSMTEELISEHYCQEGLATQLVDHWKSNIIFLVSSFFSRQTNKRRKFPRPAVFSVFHLHMCIKSQNNGLNLFSIIVLTTTLSLCVDVNGRSVYLLWKEEAGGPELAGRHWSVCSYLAAAALSNHAAPPLPLSRSHYFQIRL